MLNIELLCNTLDAAINVTRSLSALYAPPLDRPVASELYGRIQKSSIPDASKVKLVASLIAAAPSDDKSLLLLGECHDGGKLPDNLQPFLRSALDAAAAHGVRTQADGIKLLVEVLAEIPSAELITVFNKLQLTALRDLANFAYVTGIDRDVNASVATASEKLVATDDAHPHA